MRVAIAIFQSQIYNNLVKVQSLLNFMQLLSYESHKTDRLIHYVISICQGVTLIIIRISIHKSGFCNVQNICTTAALTCHNRKLDFACQMCEKSRPIFEVSPTLQKSGQTRLFYQRHLRMLMRDIHSKASSSFIENAFYQF